MKIKSSKFRVPEGEKVDLKLWNTNVGKLYDGEAKYKAFLEKSVEDLSDHQNVLYASDKYSLLLIFQAMDAAGKDGAIKHVMSGVNPQGCQVFSFKAPSPEELDHDFLWRSSGRLPERGRIGIFNRSYYEEVLIVKVHPSILKNQPLPEEIRSDPQVWEKRYESIKDFEKHLHRNGTRIVKIFLHLSKDEQARRFLARINEPDKNWKMQIGDLKEREYWDQYMEAYQDCITATSTEKSPWYIVPADDKMNARLIISDIILETIDDMNLSYPVSTEAHRLELETLKEALVKEIHPEG
ncbi:MAG: polyphosphate kinase 2 family protein [Eubacteriaceae bacterium]|nr:polyphosphate kinase 2 family protein [Eubacteriaceae bacterium]